MVHSSTDYVAKATELVAQMSVEEKALLLSGDGCWRTYRIDRLLTQWRLSGAFQKVKGIALGRFSRCQAPLDVKSFTVEEVLRDRLAGLGIVPWGSRSLFLGCSHPCACPSL